MTKLDFSFDGFGINDETDPYKSRIATLSDKYRARKDIGALIEAAPQLLEALKACERALELRDPEAEEAAAKQARAVIAKAENESGAPKFKRAGYNSVPSDDVSRYLPPSPPNQPASDIADLERQLIERFNEQQAMEGDADLQIAKPNDHFRIWLGQVGSYDEVAEEYKRLSTATTTPPPTNVPRKPTGGIGPKR